MVVRVRVHLIGAELTKVLGHELHIQEGEVGIGKPVHQSREGDLGRIPTGVVHGLGKEGPPQRQAVDAAAQLTAEIRSNAVGPAEPMKFKEDADELLRQPRLFPIGAGTDDSLEVHISSDLETPLPEGASQPSRDVEVFDGKQRTRLRKPPVYLAGLIRLRHREVALGVSVDHHFGRESRHAILPIGVELRDYIERQSQPFMARNTYIVQSGDHAVSLESDGKQVFDDRGAAPLKVTDLGDGRFAVLYDGKSRVVTIEAESQQGVTLRMSGAKHSVTWKDRQALLLESMGFASGEEEAEREIRAPMPGLVLNVLVEVGQAISAGDGLVVLEAMKMENELRAGTDGVVERIHVSVGEAVGKDALLIEVMA